MILRVQTDKLSSHQFKFTYSDSKYAEKMSATELVDPDKKSISRDTSK